MVSVSYRVNKKPFHKDISLSVSHLRPSVRPVADQRSPWIPVAHASPFLTSSTQEIRLRDELWRARSVVPSLTFQVGNDWQLDRSQTRGNWPRPPQFPPTSKGHNVTLDIKMWFQSEFLKPANLSKKFIDDNSFFLYVCWRRTTNEGESGGGKQTGRRLGE